MLQGLVGLIKQTSSNFPKLISAPWEFSVRFARRGPRHSLLPRGLRILSANLLSIHAFCLNAPLNTILWKFQSGLTAVFLCFLSGNINFRSVYNTILSKFPNVRTICGMFWIRCISSLKFHLRHIIWPQVEQQQQQQQNLYCKLIYKELLDVFYFFEINHNEMNQKWPVKSGIWR